VCVCLCVCVCVCVKLTPFEQSNNTYITSRGGHMAKRNKKSERKKTTWFIVWVSFFGGPDFPRRSVGYNIILYTYYYYVLRRTPRHPFRWVRQVRFSAWSAPVFSIIFIIIIVLGFFSHDWLRINLLFFFTVQQSNRLNSAHDGWRDEPFVTIIMQKL